MDAAVRRGALSRADFRCSKGVLIWAKARWY
jgi:hypothetical protein